MSSSQIQTLALMPNYQAVSRSAHANKRWKLFNSFAFASKDTVVELVVDELPSAVMHLPIAFVRHSDQFKLVAVQGLKPEQNLFVGTNGQWVGGYTAAAYRGYPFNVAKNEEGQHTLVVDADSGLVNDSEGESFFDEQGKPTERIAQIFDFLLKTNRSREITRTIVALLTEHQLIQPWPIKVNQEAGEYQVEGLYRIDEARLNQIDAEALQALQQAGALPLAYCQLLSMQHLQTLGKLAEAQATAQSNLSTSTTGDLDLEFLNNNGTISFGSM